MLSKAILTRISALGAGWVLLSATAAGTPFVATMPAGVPDAEWLEIARGGQRPDRALHSMIYDEVNQLFWIYGGVEGDYNGSRFRDTLFRLDATDPEAQWQLVSASGTKPPPLAFHTATYDSMRQRMLVYGGLTDRSGTGQSVASGTSLWSLDLEDPEAVSWSRQAAHGIPVDRFAHAAAYVPELDALIVSGGGQTLQSLTSTNYALLLGARPLEWVRLANAGFNVRAGHLLLYDAVGQRLIAYGGASDLNQITSLNDVIYLDISKGLDAESSWRRLSTSSPAVRRAFMAGAFDPLRQQWWVQGGIESSDRFSRDLSVLDLSVDPPAWIRTQTIYNGPLERFAHVAAWDGPRDRAVFQGGTPDNAFTVPDTRALVLLSAITPTATPEAATATATVVASATATSTSTATVPGQTSTPTSTDPPAVTDTPTDTPTATDEAPATATPTVEPSATPLATATGTEIGPPPLALYLPFAQKPR